MPWLVELLNDVRRFVDDLAHREASGPRDSDGLEAQVRAVRGRVNRWSGAVYSVVYDAPVTEAEVLAGQQAWSRTITLKWELSTLTAP